MAEFSKEETDKMVEAFKKLGVKPKSDNPEDLKKWMIDVVNSGELGDVKPNVGKRATNFFRHPLRISSFSGTSKDSDFDICKYENECLIAEKVYSSEDIM